MTGARVSMVVFVGAKLAAADAIASLFWCQLVLSDTLSTVLKPVKHTTTASLKYSDQPATSTVCFQVFALL